MKTADVDTPLSVKFLTAGTAACVADAASFPLDTAKVRLQVRVRVCACVHVCVQLRKTENVFVYCQLECRAK
jgi:Mitochondrial carrier protein.